MDTNTRRVLVLAGGGARGYLEVKWLQKWIATQGITLPLYKIFDVIAGASAGALNGVSLAYGKSLEELEAIYKNEIPKVFSTALIGADGLAIVPSLYDKISGIVTSTPFYSEGKVTYGVDVLGSVLSNNFGEKTLQDLQTNVLVTALNVTRGEFQFFSNFSHDYLCTPNEKIINVLRATSAAPIYLPPYIINSELFRDGGVYNNFPASTAVLLSKLIKQTAKRTKVLFLGTGKEKDWILTKGVDASYTQDNQNRDTAIGYLKNLFNLASYGFVETEMMNLRLASDYTLDPISCYGFDPVLTAKLTYKNAADVQFTNYSPESIELDNTTGDFRNYMDELVKKDFIDNRDKISLFTSELMQ